MTEQMTQMTRTWSMSDETSGSSSQRENCRSHCENTELSERVALTIHSECSHLLLLVHLLSAVVASLLHDGVLQEASWQAATKLRLQRLLQLICGCETRRLRIKVTITSQQGTGRADSAGGAH
jgi:hypothetical protein